MLDKSISDNLNKILQSCLVIDIETSAFYPSDNREINIKSDFENYLKYAKIKWVGLYSFRDDKSYYLNAKNDTQQILTIISEHSTLVGFNLTDFDYPILVNNGFVDIEKKYLQVDCMTILGDSTFKNKDGYKFKGRANLMGYQLKSHSLKAIAKAMELETQKGEIDFHIFQKNQWSIEEEKEIISYLSSDVMATKEMFLKLWNYWLPFSELLEVKNVYDLSWIRSSIASLTYKAACRVLNTDPTYAEGKTEAESMGGHVIMPKYEELKGVWYVDVGSLYPHMFAMGNLTAETDDENQAIQAKNDYFTSTNYFNKRLSLRKDDDEFNQPIYDDIEQIEKDAELIFNKTLQSSLEAKKKSGKKIWHGGDVFKVKGYYDISKWHPLAKYIASKLRERIALKETDPKNPFIYTLKIFLNGLYGVMRSPIFEKVHTPNCGWDCCYLGQQCQALIKEMLEQFGFEVVMGDTDSCFFIAKEGTDNSRAYVQECLTQIADIIKDNFPFPVDTFKIGIEHYLDYLMVPFSEQPIADDKTQELLNHQLEMLEEHEEKLLTEPFIFQTINNKECIVNTLTNEVLKIGRSWTEKRQGKKKNYLMIYKDKEETIVKLVGLPIKKDNATALGIKIFDEVLKPEIIKNTRAKFPKSFIENKVNEYLQRPEAMELISQEYKVNAASSYKTNCIQAQISKGYFKGMDGVIRLIKNNKIGKAGKGTLYCTIQEALDAKLTVAELDLEKVFNELEPFVEYNEIQPLKVEHEDFKKEIQTIQDSINLKIGIEEPKKKRGRPKKIVTP